MGIHVVKGADGLDRRAFSADDVRRMVDAGILNEDDRVELLDGELIQMSPKGFVHDRIKDALVAELFAAVDRSIRISVEGTLQLDAMTLVEPDILVCRLADASASVDGFKTIAGPNVLLAIEVAVSSLSYDRRRKATLYARHGVSEYWIVDVNALRIVVHRAPDDGRYGHVHSCPPEEGVRALAPELAGFRLVLSDLF